MIVTLVKILILNWNNGHGQVIQLTFEYEIKTSPQIKRLKVFLYIYKN